MNNDVHTLTGAYVLDALSEMERRAFEDHMSGCPACHQEVAELQETTARLGTATALPPPPQLWHKVHMAIGNARQLPPLSLNEPPVLRPRRGNSRFAIFAAAASIVVAAGLGTGWVVTNNDVKNELAQTQTELSRLQTLLSAPDAKVVTGPVEGGGTATAVVSASQNGMVMTVKDAPALRGTTVYHLWYVRGTGPGEQTSAGTLASSNGSIGSNDLTPAQGAKALAITVEPPGATSPNLDAVVARISLV
ncbi:anti-sigma factor [Kibdelosporangium philippinense]|uniref:Regulator of SigK n=1 Tax=Kibdelosporangium philippinense TaxID=211113 RepID=A0ABS8ZJU3_9PSEU|nr:anti-sigma factor [Kibdelosporangium philippinense]MCE7008046.1 anti-sigma factor [Kibdelosporangium philippinense]